MSKRGARTWTAPPASTPSIAGDTVVVGGWDGSVVALGLADGAVRWRTSAPVEGPAMVGASGDQVFVVDEDGGTAALEAVDRRRASGVPTSAGARSGPPSTVDGTLYVTSADGMLSALDPTDGSVAWQYGLGPTMAPAVVVDGVAYAVTTLGGLVAVGDAADPRRPRTGATDPDPAAGLAVAGGGPARAGRHPGPGPDTTPVVAWSRAFDSDIDSPPVIADGLVLVGNREAFLFAIDARTGEERWRFATGNWISQSAAVAGDRAFVGDEDGGLFAVAVADGQPALDGRPRRAGRRGDRGRR